MNERQEPSIYWRLVSELSIRQAALLAIGEEPSSEIGSNCENWKEHERPADYEAVKQALISALRKGIIAGEHWGIIELDMYGNECGEEVPGTTDIDKSYVDFDSLVHFFESRNIRPPFLFPPKPKADTPDYLDPNHPRYSGKLAASVRAWQAMDDENLLRGKNPIPAMTEWLETRYKDFGLVHRQDSKQHGYKTGDRIDGAIKEAARVANWQTEGGAPKTPEKANPPPQGA